MLTVKITAPGMYYVRLITVTRRDRERERTMGAEVSARDPRGIRNHSDSGREISIRDHESPNCNDFFEQRHDREDLT